MRLMVILSVLLFIKHTQAQDTMSFSTSKEMADYAFSATDFSSFRSTYLVNRSMEMDSKKYERFLAGDEQTVRGENNIGLFTLLQWWDVQGTFSRDQILFPVFDHLTMLDHEISLEVPLFIVDVNVMKIN